MFGMRVFFFGLMAPDYFVDRLRNRHLHTTYVFVIDKVFTGYLRSVVLIAETPLSTRYMPVVYCPLPYTIFFYERRTTLYSHVPGIRYALTFLGPR